MDKTNVAAPFICAQRQFSIVVEANICIMDSFTIGRALLLMSNRKSLLATAVLSLSLIFSASISTGQSTVFNLNAIRSDIAAIELEISETEASNGSYQGGALALIASLNLETLRLTKSVLEARLVAEETGAPIKIVVPAVQPDPAQAQNLIADIQMQQANVEAAKAEAANAGGLMAALALTRYETEKLSLTQLRQAWFRAQYGIAFPTSGALQAPTPVVAPTDNTTEEVDLGVVAKPDWADPDYPDIDYGAEIFKQLTAGDFNILGWWGIKHSRAALDDSPQVFAINVSDYGTGYSDHPSLKVMCHEKEARVIFDADSFIMGDYQTGTLPVTVRIGDETAVQQRWSKLTSNKGAGLFGAEAQGLIRQFMGEEKVFIRLEGDRGQLYDLSLQMEGSERVFNEVANACQFSLLDLGREDYKAIQTLLNAPERSWIRSRNAGWPVGVGITSSDDGLSSICGIAGNWNAKPVIDSISVLDLEKPEPAFSFHPGKMFNALAQFHI